MQIYNSLTKQKTELNLSLDHPFKLYACGPTVYNYIHLGNARPSFTVDFLVRFLEFQGYEVDFLQNITDIDDKIINQALETKTDELELSKFYADQYLADLKQLNIRQPNKMVKVSDSIEQMISFIEKLIANGSAYLVDGDVYFDVKKYLQDYGKLSGQQIGSLNNLEPNDKKNDPLDFALWKKTDKGLKWKTPFGEGRPGWHTECVVMIDNYFSSQTIDLHAGGIDLKFPHHENERIQFLAAYNEELAKVWMHNGHLTFDNEKMSKSLGNFIFVKDFLVDHDPDLLRWIFMKTSFTQPLDINDELINEGQTFLTKLNNLNKKAKQLFALDQLDVSEATGSQNHLVEAFKTFMEDNLNTASVLSLIEQAIKNLNSSLSQKKLITDWHELQIIFQVLGYKLQLDYYVSEQDKTLIQEWNRLVQEKNFEKADQLREQLIAKGLL